MKPARYKIIAVIPHNHFKLEVSLLQAVNPYHQEELPCSIQTALAPFICSSEQVKSLDLGNLSFNPPVTPKDLNFLAVNFPRIESLQLKIQMTDEGFKELAEFKHLKSVKLNLQTSIDHPPVTGIFMPLSPVMSNVKKIQLYPVEFCTPEAKRKLKILFPQAEIILGFGNEGTWSHLENSYVMVMGPIPQYSKLFSTSPMVVGKPTGWTLDDFFTHLNTPENAEKMITLGEIHFHAAIHHFNLQLLKQLGNSSHFLTEMILSNSQNTMDDSDKIKGHLLSRNKSGWQPVIHTFLDTINYLRDQGAHIIGIDRDSQDPFGGDDSVERERHMKTHIDEAKRDSKHGQRLVLHVGNAHTDSLGREGIIIKCGVSVTSAIHIFRSSEHEFQVLLPSTPAQLDQIPPVQKLAFEQFQTIIPRSN